MPSRRSRQCKGPEVGAGGEQLQVWGPWEARSGKGMEARLLPSVSGSRCRVQKDSCGGWAVPPSLTLRLSELSCNLPLYKEDREQ